MQHESGFKRGRSSRPAFKVGEQTSGFGVCRRDRERPNLGREPDVASIQAHTPGHRMWATVACSEVVARAWPRPVRRRAIRPGRLMEVRFDERAMRPPEPHQRTIGPPSGLEPAPRRLF